MKVLEHWWLYLIWTEKPFIIEMDHKNLTYWKSSKKLTERTVHWHKKLQDLKSCTSLEKQTHQQMSCCDLMDKRTKSQSKKCS